MDILKKYTEGLLDFDVGIKDADVQKTAATMEETLNRVMQKMFTNTLIIVAFILIVSYLLFVRGK